MIKILDAHVDIADMYNEFGLTKSDFYSDRDDIPVSYKQIMESGISVLGLTLYFDKSQIKTSFYDGAKEYFEFYKDLLDERFVNIKTSADLDKVSNKVGYFLTIEGLDCLRTLDDFNEFYNLGVRLFGMTWNNDNQFACGRLTQNDTGISPLGVEFLKAAEKKKIILDIAHLSEKSVKDLAQNYSGTIVCTHSNVRAVFESKYNLTDEEIDIVVKSGGVMTLMPLVEMVGKEGTFDELFRHFEYIVNKWGIDYVSFSSDIYPLPAYPFIKNHQTILIMKDLREFLLTKLSEKEVEKVMFGNWERVLRNNL